MSQHYYCEACQDWHDIDSINRDYVQAGLVLLELYANGAR